MPIETRPEMKSLYRLARRQTRQTDRGGGGQTNRHSTDRQTDKQTDKQTDRQTDRQTNRQTDKQTDRQTDRQTNRQTDKQTDIRDRRDAHVASPILE